MNWQLRVSRNAAKFIAKNRVSNGRVADLVGKALHSFRGEEANADIKKLKGAWAGFYRIRSGRMRIIAEFDFQNSAVFIEEIDWRGNVYR